MCHQHNNTNLIGYLIIPTVSFGYNIHIKDMNNLISMSQIQLQAISGNIFDVGGSTLTLNTNNQSVHVCSVANVSDDTLLHLV